MVRPIYKGRIITLGVEQVTLPNGREIDLEIVRHPGGAAVAAIDERDRICLIRQYRHAADGWLWELPAGKIDNREEPLLTAKRELAEEAGVKASEWQSLGLMRSSPGVFDEVIHLYLATGLTRVEQSLEADEVLEVHWMPIQEALQWAVDGKINDAKSVIALFRARGAG